MGVSKELIVVTPDEIAAVAPIDAGAGVEVAIDLPTLPHHGAGNAGGVNLPLDAEQFVPGPTVPKTISKQVGGFEGVEFGQSARQGEVSVLGGVAKPVFSQLAEVGG